MKTANRLIIIAIISLLLILYLHSDTSLIQGDPAFYTGSDNCIQCHEEDNQSWQHSQHAKIFKPYTDDSQILADFNNPPDFVSFNKSDIEVIIGGKWEQVFARQIDGEYYPFTAKWMILTQQWVPFKTQDWQETPLNQKCNGCHTTGLNIETGKFNEYGVVCEACHGPASRHVENKRMLQNSECSLCHNSNELKEQLAKEVDIVSSIKSAVCGQCHNRGVETQLISHQNKIQFEFPVEFLPGQQISNNFQQSSPETDPGGDYWWGNGVSKNRHQEYADFARSNHSRSLDNLRIKRNPFCTDNSPEGNCLKCHSGDYIQAIKHQQQEGHNEDSIIPTLDNAQDGITCVICHDPHTVGTATDNNINQCIECHTATTKTLRKQKPHYPCPEDKVLCVDCHMPKIVETGGMFSLRSHAFKIIPPQASIKYGMPNSCQNGGCHADKNTQWAIDEYDLFYKKEDNKEDNKKGNKEDSREKLNHHARK